MESTTHNLSQRFLVIYNEQSGTSYYDHRKIIIETLAKHDVTAIIHNTTPDGSFLDLDPNTFNRIVVAGGDGTLKEVANWLMKHHSKTPMAIIARGSGNIVAQALDIPFQTQKAAELAATGKVQQIDMGLINHREYFILAASIGFDAQVIKNTSRALKRVFGVSAYILGFLKSIFNIRPNKTFIKSDAYEGILRTQSIVISNVQSFFNYKLSPEDTMSDGCLSVSIFRSPTLFDILSVLRKIVKGDYSKDWRHTTFQTKKIYILPFHKYPHMQIDGEMAQLPYLDVEAVPRALNVVTNKVL